MVEVKQTASALSTTGRQASVKDKSGRGALELLLLLLSRSDSLRVG